MTDVPTPPRLARRAARGLRALLALFLAPALLAGCSTGEANEAGSALQTATVERRDIVSSVEATGTVEPIKVIDIKSQASGEITELPVELGDQVEQGQLLVRIDPRDVRNAFEQAEADLEVARARFEVAQRQLERTQTLRDSAVVTQEELETAILEHANARAELTRAETNLELARDRMNDVTLRAPLSGTIVERPIEEGQIITGAREVTGGTILMRMADLAEVQVRTLVDETDIGRVQPGQPATITVEAYPERTFTGSVLKIEPQAVVEQNVTMFAVLTRIVNENDLLRPGMNADVEMVIGREEYVLSLPNAAVKMPQEARQLAEALGVEAEALESGGGPGGPPTAAADGEARGGTASEGAAGDGAARGGRAGESGDGGSTEGGQQIASEGALPSMERLRTMSREERMRLIQELAPADRQRLMERLSELREAQEASARANPGAPKRAFVFVTGAEGRIRLEPITIGLSNFDYTEVIDGLEEGDQVLEVPLSLVQQQELLNRIRERSGVPGVSRN